MTVLNLQRSFRRYFLIIIQLNNGVVILDILPKPPILIRIINALNSTSLVGCVAIQPIRKIKLNVLLFGLSLRVSMINIAGSCDN